LSLNINRSGNKNSTLAFNDLNRLKLKLLGTSQIKFISRKNCLFPASIKLILEIKPQIKPQLPDFSEKERRKGEI